MPFLLETPFRDNSSPNTPTIPSSDCKAVINDERLAISATVTVPYSLLKAPHADPELSDRQAVLPFNLALF